MIAAKGDKDACRFWKLWLPEQSLCLPPCVPGLWTRSSLDRSPLQEVRCRNRGSSSLVKPVKKRRASTDWLIAPPLVLKFCASLHPLPPRLLEHAVHQLANLPFHCLLLPLLWNSLLHVIPVLEMLRWSCAMLWSSLPLVPRWLRPQSSSPMKHMCFFLDKPLVYRPDFLSLTLQLDTLPRSSRSSSSELGRIIGPS